MTSRPRADTTIRPALGRQLRPVLPVLAYVCVAAGVALCALVLVNLYTDTPISLLTRDVVESLDAPVYAGLYSSLGVLLLSSTAAVCLFSAIVLRWFQGRSEWSSFLLFAGSVTAYLALDDLFLLHEIVFPKELHIPQNAVILGYSLVIGLFLAAFARTILRTDFLLLGAAFVFFAGSLAVDAVYEESDFRLTFIADDFLGRHLVEDGFKLVGIAVWAAYFIRICLLQFRELASSAPDKSALGQD